jgi:hypothetical protein
MLSGICVRLYLSQTCPLRFQTNITSWVSAQVPALAEYINYLPAVITSVVNAVMPTLIFAITDFEQVCVCASVFVCACAVFPLTCNLLFSSSHVTSFFGVSV